MLIAYISEMNHKIIIVTDWTKAPFLVHKFFMVYLSILEGMPTKPTVYVGRKQNDHHMALKI